MEKESFFGFLFSTKKVTCTRGIGLGFGFFTNKSTAFLADFRSINLIMMPLASIGFPTS